MVELMHLKNRILQRKLDDLIEQARANERKQELYEAFGFEIIMADTPRELRDLILSAFKVRFRLDDVVLCLVDRYKDTERLFIDQSEGTFPNAENRLLILDTFKDADKIGSLDHKPLLGPEVFKKYHWMIASLKFRDQMKGAAYLPLQRGDRIVGVLLLLSHDINRFPQNVGTLFLQKLSAMTAVAIENCLNQQRIKEISYQDMLTQVYNRRYFDFRFKEEIARSLRGDDDLVCMLLDVDHFKTINDTYGHQVGDQVLIHLASLIKKQIRACDIVARYGGEEFVVLLPATALQPAHEIAERLRQAVGTYIHNYSGRQFQITISLGIANLRSLNVLHQRDSALIGTALVDRADKALYHAKAGGRNQIAVYNNPATV